MNIKLLDDSTRPKAPKIDGITDQQRRHGRRLAHIHAMHLQQMSEVRRVMEETEAGERGSQELREAVISMQMAANYRLFGNLCGQECAMLNFHHTAEDRFIFPALMQGSEGLRNVVERLSAEHRIIHQMLEQLEAAAIAMVSDPGEENFAKVKEIFEILEKTVQSHFGYEEHELQEAIGYWNVPI